MSTFNSKFSGLCPNRRPLFLTALNEYGVLKFVPTTLRPTLLPYRQVYEAQQVATFIANFLDYEPLENPIAPPDTLPSPSQVLEWGVGDCFDYSVLLASFLLGAGYDAFVVYGYAPEWVCLRDQTHTVCPLLVAERIDEEMKAADKEGEGKHSESEAKDTRYVARPRGVPKSTYQSMMQTERTHGESKEAAETWESDEGEDFKDDDALHGQRVHSWVLIRGGKRETHDMYFIEATTGAIFPVSDSPYLGIEAIWNAKNYWVNMQLERSMDELSYDTLNPELWEYVFIDAASAAAAAKTGGDDFGEQQDNLDMLGGAAKRDEEEDADVVQNILDVPPSWVNKLNIPKKTFSLAYPPLGQRSVLYHKAKLELFAENMHPQGTVTRLSLYKDRARTIVKECRESFTNRGDYLDKRVRYPLEGKVMESFLPGRYRGLETLVEWTGKRREMKFYVSARQDGLVCREVALGEKIIERFEGRADHLEYRSVTVKEDHIGSSKAQYTLPAGGQGGELVVQKMCQKFKRDEYKDADEDVAKRTFYVLEGRIVTMHHYADGKVTRVTQTHFKDRSAGTSSANAAAAGGDDEGGLHAMLAAERDCLQAVRAAQMEMLELLKVRRREEMNVTVERPIFETAHERQTEANKVTGTVDVGHVETNQLHVDYLTPFLENVGDPNDVSREEAQRAHDACLKSLKERLLERANIIQTRLNEENQKLARKQATFQRNQRENDTDAEEAFEKYCSESMFRITILEQRLAMHEDTAVKKFEELDAKLSGDPRLSVLLGAR